MSTNLTASIPPSPPRLPKGRAVGLSLLLVLLGNLPFLIIGQLSANLAVQLPVGLVSLGVVAALAFSTLKRAEVPLPRILLAVGIAMAGLIWPGLLYGLYTFIAERVTAVPALVVWYVLNLAALVCVNYPLVLRVLGR